MALTRKVHADLGSEQIKLIMEQLNRLTATVEAIVDASVGVGGDAWSDIVDDLDVSDYETLVASPNVPAGRRIPAL